MPARVAPAAIGFLNPSFSKCSSMLAFARPANGLCTDHATSSGEKYSWSVPARRNHIAREVPFSTSTHTGCITLWSISTPNMRRLSSGLSKAALTRVP
jgi:hypothetical protein